MSGDIDLDHGEAPRELVIYAGEEPVARLQMLETKRYDRVVAHSLKAMADSLEESAPLETIDPRDCEFEIEEADRDE